jgi:radical SAM modification target selenobiotic family peptide
MEISPLTSQEATMDVEDLKKILAGFCIAGLIAGSTFTLSSCAAGKSAWSGDKAGAGGSASGWSGSSSGAGGTDGEKKQPAKTGWSWF